MCVANNNITATEIDAAAEDKSTVAASLQLSWTAPVAREDESPISMAEIAGYRIYYGTETGNYKQTIKIDDAYTDSIILDELIATDTYYQ